MTETKPAPYGERIPIAEGIECPMCHQENVKRATNLYVTRLRYGLLFECDSCTYHWTEAEVVK